MKKFCAAAIACLILPACSGNGSTQVATGTDGARECGARLTTFAPGGEIHASCLPKLPPLTDAQKKTVFATLSAASLNDLVVGTYLFGGPADEEPGEAELLQALTNAKCSRETSQDPEGRSLGRISGEGCPLEAQSSFRNDSTSAGSREEKKLEITVRGEDYAARSGLAKLSHSEAADGKVTETASKRYHLEMSGSIAEAFEGTAGRMTSEGGLTGSGDVDASNPNDVKIVSMDVREGSRLRFPDFAAVLNVRLALKEDGTGSFEATLNGEPIALPAGVKAAIRAKLETAAIRQVVSGI